MSLAGDASGKETIKIGLITPLTGDVKTFGESSKNAFYVALDNSDRAYVFENGRVTMHGQSMEIKHNQGIIEAYLGV